MNGNSSHESHQERDSRLAQNQSSEWAAQAVLKARSNPHLALNAQADHILGELARMVHTGASPEAFAQALASQSQITLPPALDAWALLRLPQSPAPPILVEGLLHQSLKALLAGASKSMKSWLALSLALAVASGTKWLGRFGCTRTRVFFLNMEVPAWAFEARLRDVAAALELSLAPGDFFIWNLRGHDLSSDKLWGKLADAIRSSGTVGLIVVDPLYKLFGATRSENDANSAGVITRRSDALAETLGCAILHTHHYAKGDPSAKEAIDRFSGSGVLVRDPDVYLPMTRHAQSNCFTIEPTLRCLPPAAPFVVRWRYPLFELVPEADPAELKKPLGAKKRFFVADLVEQLGAERLPTLKFAKRCRNETGMSNGTFYSLLAAGNSQGALFKSKIDKLWEVTGK